MIGSAVLVTGHDADAGDSIGDAERKFIHVMYMDVHVPQAGDKKTTVSVKGVGQSGVGFLRGGNRGDAGALDSHGLFFAFGAGCHIDDGDGADRTLG